jgi:mono/diheme cytochrome c family protein
MVKFLAFIGFLAIVLAIAAAGYFFGGFYNVAATVAEPAIVQSALVQVRQASIARHAKEASAMPPEDANTVRAGARAYSERGCVNCHGAPGVNWAKWSEGLRPDPPDLKKIADQRQRNELFWVIKHGIGMTGMPSFGAAGASDDEIWTIATFVKRLPGVSAEDYKSWTTP